MIGVGNGGYQPNIATFGADQFDEKHPKESHSKVTFFSYFYLAFNLAALFSETILGYFEDQGMWALGFWVSTSSAFAALILFLGGTKEYRHHHHSSSSSSSSSSSTSSSRLSSYVKCMFKLLPIWLCTIFYSVVYTQMDSLFVEQGDAMNTKISNFEIPPASMSSFNVLAVVVFVFLCNRMHKKTSEIQRMGIGLVIAIASMISAGIVECYRLKYANELSNLSIFWLAPQYALIGASEVFMYVAQLEFFNARAPDGFKSFGSALCMSSISFGSYVSSYLVSIVMKISTKNNKLGWIPEDLNKGHLDRFYFLLAGLTAIDLVMYIVCANWYINAGKTGEDNQEQSHII
ncbi:hypothetical protein ACJIZ3_009697 [Penstemon smallii]|uniref:Uncharacterized protein n=1 Tax=Penstemon smallii TaxID=265156 RepID=A0ABD3TEC0_9LAMI